MKTKKKKAASKSESEPVIQEEIVEHNDAHNHKEKEYTNDRPFDRSGSAPRNRRNDRAPPRFQRGK
jgi:hypothetical protein